MLSRLQFTKIIPPSGLEDNLNRVHGGGKETNVQMLSSSRLEQERLMAWNQYSGNRIKSERDPRTIWGLSCRLNLESRLKNILKQISKTH